MKVFHPLVLTRSNSLSIAPDKGVWKTLLAAGLGLMLGACGGAGGGGGGDVVTPPVAAPLMSITPDSSYFGKADQGGLASPSSMDYLVKNIGDAPLDWSVQSTETWARVMPRAGVLDPQEEVMVHMSVNNPQVQRYPSGLLTGSLDFENITNGAGSGSRGITLDIVATSQPTLSVSPDQDFDASGLKGGPFTPGSKVYTVTNEGSIPVTWAARTSGAGILLDVSGGDLAPGASQAVTASIDQAAASLLGIGDHYQALSFVINGLGSSPVVRTLTVHVRPSGAGTTSKSLSQFGITWTFDKSYEVGQFANDDWWVKGPVHVVDIYPPSTSKATRRQNGSMVNPSAINGSSQGYDTSAYAQYSSANSYQDKLNVALDVSASNPLALAAGSSLVSTASLAKPDQRPQFASSAILTVLANPAPVGSFRPAYSALRKTIKFNESQLDYSKLSRLRKIPVTPNMVEAERWFLRPWVDHVPSFLGRYVHPSDNMPDYGREIADQIGTATLMLNMNFTDAEKRKLLVRVIQVGIDEYGVFEREGKRTWLPNGGHMSGRKWPILFAGLMLNDSGMASVGMDNEAIFSEDSQTFYVSETSTGVYNYGFGSYTRADLGTADWGVLHGLRPSYDEKDWYGNPYRLCCTANVWWGEALSAYIMGAKGIWNHDAFFDYIDRYHSENLARGIQDYRMAWTKFPYAMWKAYRSNY